jgi:hypothetical protein
MVAGAFADAEGARDRSAGDALGVGAMEGTGADDTGPPGEDSFDAEPVTGAAAGEGAAAAEEEGGEACSAGAGAAGFAGSTAGAAGAWAVRVAFDDAGRG